MDIWILVMSSCEWVNYLRAIDTVRLKDISGLGASFRQYHNSK